jgi:group I intron endonuclease
MISYKNNSAKSGIYQIKNMINGKIYIGSAMLIGNRKWRHFKELSLKKHSNSKLQSAYNKYGKNVFIFEILELCSKECLIEREQYYLDNLLKANTNDLYFKRKGYNILKIANNSLGFKHSQKTKDLISKLQKGKKVSNKTKNLLYKYSKGRIVSKETRQKLRNIQLNKKRSEKTINKLKLINLGRKQSEETIIKRIKSQYKPVVLYDINDNFIKEFNSLIDCSDYLKISKGYLSNLITNKKNYKNLYKIKKKT